MTDDTRTILSRILIMCITYSWFNPLFPKSGVVNLFPGPDENRSYNKDPKLILFLKVHKLYYKHTV